MDSKQIKKGLRSFVTGCDSQHVFPLYMPCVLYVWISAELENRLCVKTVGEKQAARHKGCFINSWFKGGGHPKRWNVEGKNTFLIRSWSMTGSNVKIIPPHCFSIELCCVRVRAGSSLCWRNWSCRLNTPASIRGETCREPKETLPTNWHVCSSSPTVSENIDSWTRVFVLIMIKN